MSFQKCPICNGTGIDPAPGYTTSNACPTCGVCQGKRIISELTGLPPVHVEIFNTPQYQPPKHDVDPSHYYKMYFPFYPTQTPTQDVSDIQTRESQV